MNTQLDGANKPVEVTGSVAADYYGKLLVGEKFNLDDPFRMKMYQDFFFYFAGKQDLTPLDITKSLLVTGSMGVGKTVLMRVMNMMFKRFKYCNAKRNIEMDLKRYGEVEVMTAYGFELKMDLCIDDATTEEENLFVYKNPINLVGQILLERYDLFQSSRGQFKTHIITNALTNKLADRYGERVFDRLCEMSNLVEWEGASLRTL